MGLEGKRFKGREDRKCKNELMKNTEMKCKNLIINLGKGRRGKMAEE